MRSDGTRHGRDGNRNTDLKRNSVGWFSIARLSCSRAGDPAAVSTRIIDDRDLIEIYPAATAVAGVSFKVPEGICFGLLGPNGAGKTTTIEIMEGILPPSSGEVRYRGAPLGARFHQEAGILFQKTALQDFLTVRQCLGLFRG